MKIDLRRGFAEFTLIVMGVLVALAVDDWREGRESRDTELHLLTVLAGDLAQDSALYAQSIARSEARIASAVRLLERLGEPRSVTAHFRENRPEVFGRSARTVHGIPPTADAVAEDLLRASLSWPVLASTTSFDEMTSAGTLSLVRPPELTTAIVRYYQFVESEVRGGEAFTASVAELRRFLVTQGVSALDPIFVAGLLDSVRDTAGLRVRLRDVVNGAEGESDRLSHLEEARATLSTDVHARLAQLDGAGRDP